MHKYKVANVLRCVTNEQFTIDCGNAFGKLSRATHIHQRNELSSFMPATEPHEDNAYHSLVVSADIHKP